MLPIFSTVSLEAQKLITVSIGKINASRVTRTGSSLHKSLLVASVLHKARNIYLEEERDRASRYPQCPPELTVTPVCPINKDLLQTNDSHNVEDKENRLTCPEDEVATGEKVGEESRLPLGEAKTGNNLTHTTNTTTTVTSLNCTTTITTTSSSSQSRKRRRVSDQETAAAISSILPKRLRSELKETTQGECGKIAARLLSESVESEMEKRSTDSCEDSSTTEHSPELASRLAPSEVSSDSESEESSTTGDAESKTAVHKDEEDSDSSDSEDAASDTSTSSCDDEMEVDQLTSLVSYFSLAQSSKKSEYCLSPIHAQLGPHVVALTA